MRIRDRRLHDAMGGATGQALTARAEEILRPAWNRVRTDAASAPVFAGISGTMHCLKAVSYTHLDVYKRQASVCLVALTPEETKICLLAWS